MARLLALYNPPADAVAFDRYYHETHVPLIRKLPGLRTLGISRNPVHSVVGQATHLVTTMDFDSLAAAQAALESSEGQAAAGDLANFAQAGVTLLMFDTV